MKEGSYLYMVVTADRFELPLSPPMRCCELATLLGIKSQAILDQLSPSRLSRNRGKNFGVRFVRFNKADLEETEKDNEL